MTESSAGVSILALPGVDGDRRTAQSVRLAYRLHTSPGSELPLVVIHGSPGRGEGLRALSAALAPLRSVMVPDLPGFGWSTRVIPDYSFRAHAIYVRDLLQHLEMPRAHVLGYSMGGGVALHLVDLDPSRVASLTLLSSIGVQEMELLGQYHLNHAVHGVQLAAFGVAKWLLPHGGALDAPLPYARNFFDSDQRPLRDMLKRVAVPTLIAHGRTDPLVPVEAAVEHARLVPQSHLTIFDDDHFMVFTSPGPVAAAINDFVSRVEQGREPDRQNAPLDRIDAADRRFDARIVPRARAVTAAVLAGLIGALCWSLGGVAPVGAGVLAAQGRLALWLATLAVAAGVGGRSLLKPRARSSRSLRTTAAALVEAAARVALGDIGGRVLLAVPLPLVAGAWTRAVLVTLTLAVSTGLLSAVISVRRRRLWASQWLRVRRWEYWPPWLFYLPVVAYVARLMIRYRSPMIFTAANPAILAGGVVGESKIDILDSLAGAGDRVAASHLIDGHLAADQKRADATQFMTRAGLRLPVVLKPNQGQRGSGVVVARTPTQLEAYLTASRVDTVIQAYAPGLEFGVFYYRFPHETMGRVLSITEKTLPTVVGDGQRTLEALILADPSTLGMARFHLAQHAHRLSVVPPAGRVESLGECGSHCRGATFTDGRLLLTTALERSVDAIARSFDGFFFGRFDVRSPSREAFMRGELVVIELNGVTSEATHIYDARVGLREAYSTLFEQWRLAFAIGAENVAVGARPASTATVLHLLIAHRATAKAHLRPLVE